MNWSHVESLLRERYKRRLTQGECDTLTLAVRTSRRRFLILSHKTCRDWLRASKAANAA